jgi:subtilase family serine protease
MRSKARRFALPAVALLCVAVIGVTAAEAANGPAKTSRQQLAGSQPAWTAAASQTGTVADSAQLHARVWLAPRNQAQLQALAQAVSIPGGSQYRQYLTSKQYDAQFAPTSRQVQAVTSWLAGASLHVDSIGPSNHYVAVSGTAAAMRAAFGAQLGVYSVNGKSEQAPTSDYSVPASVAGLVQAVAGLTTLGHTVKPTDLGPPDGFRNAPPCSSYYGEKIATDLPKFEGKSIPYAVCGYTPSQLRGAYSVTGTGSGETVAITDAFDASTLEADANQYATDHGDPAFGAGQFQDKSVPEDSSTHENAVSDCGGNGWYGEQALDVEAVHAIATGANVLYYGAASCYDDDLMAQLAQVATDDQASIVTNSWGEPTFVRIGGHLYATIDGPLVAAYEGIFQQGASEGIGYYFSSGDYGDELASYGFKHPDFPTGDPWVTAVGGTSLAVGHDNTRLFETGWGTQKYTLNPGGAQWSKLNNFLYGAGGGYSQVFARPSYQDGVVNGHQGRAVPDIAMDADPTTGMLVGETQAFPEGNSYDTYRIGGTSLASPLMAGMQAVAQQGTGGTIGFANPLIYGLAQSSPDVYFDVSRQGDAGNVRVDYVNGLDASDGTVASVRTFDADGQLHTRGGWDDVTGVGSPAAGYLSAVASSLGG